VCELVHKDNLDNLDKKRVNCPLSLPQLRLGVRKKNCLLLRFRPLPPRAPLNAFQTSVSP